MMTLGLWFWGRNSTEVKCPSHVISVGGRYPRDCQWYFILLLSCSSTGQESWQVGSHVPLIHLSQIGFLCTSLLCYIKKSGLSCIFSCSGPSIIHFSKELWFPFAWEWYLETMIWVLGVLPALGMLLLLAPHGGWTQETCVPARLHTHNFNTFSLGPSVWSYTRIHSLSKACIHTDVSGSGAAPEEGLISAPHWSITSPLQQWDAGSHHPLCGHLFVQSQQTREAVS